MNMYPLFSIQSLRIYQRDSKIVMHIGNIAVNCFVGHVGPNYELET